MEFKIQDIEKIKLKDLKLIKISNNYIFLTIYNKLKLAKENLYCSMVDFHNMVNKLLNKPKYTYDEAEEYYGKMIENSEMLKK